MAALSLYRKYRPKTFEEIIGQEHVVRTLTNALRLNRVGHAYLFVGPRGTGKTTVARLLARYLNCLQRGPEALVCRSDDLCRNCAALYGGNQPDLIEIDAASNRGIDEVRGIIESVRVAPMQSRVKVYVIDEAHMLTREAANALLKTLEEPPAHAMFILATTSAEKLPVTILSRCQRFDFRLLTVPEISGRLRALIAAEGATVADDAVELLAQAADGSVRDAESLLEQTLVLLGEEARREDVLKLLGIPDPIAVRSIVSAILSSGTRDALDGVNAVVERGGDATALAVRIASYLRDVLLVSVDPSFAPILERRFGVAYAEGVLEQAAAVDRKRLTALIPKFIEAAELTKRSPIPQLPLELVIVESAEQSVPPPPIPAPPRNS